MSIAECVDLVAQYLKYEEAVEHLIDFFSDSVFAIDYVETIGGLKVLKIDAKLTLADEVVFRTMMVGR